AGIEIERLIQTVGMHAYEIAVGTALVNDDAVIDLRRVFVAEQVLSDHAQRLHLLAIVELGEHGADSFLRARVERGACGDIEPIEIVEAWRTEKPQQLRAHGGGSLAIDE